MGALKKHKPVSEIEPVRLIFPLLESEKTVSLYFSTKYNEKIQFATEKDGMKNGI